MSDSDRQRRIEEAKKKRLEKMKKKEENSVKLNIEEKGSR